MSRTDDIRHILNQVQNLTINEATVDENGIPVYDWEEGLEAVKNAGIKQDEALLLQRIGPEYADQYRVVATGAYMRWSPELRDMYTIVAQANNRGEVHIREMTEANKPQSQASLYDQLKELRVIANKEGLYDAADFLRNHIEAIEKNLAANNDLDRQS